VQQFLSPSLNNFSLGALPLNPLTISGSTGFGCTAVPQQFTVPNLVGCTLVNFFHNGSTPNGMTIPVGQLRNDIYTVRIFDGKDLTGKNGNRIK